VAVPFLLSTVLDADAIARDAAIETLIRIEANLPPPRCNAQIQSLRRVLLTRLMELMEHRQPAIRAAAYRAFAEMSFGADGLTALPLLRRALKDSNLAVRKYASQAIRELETLEEMQDE
jgi:HEAT repeat protein